MLVVEKRDVRWNIQYAKSIKPVNLVSSIIITKAKLLKCNDFEFRTKNIAKLEIIYNIKEQRQNK